MGEELAPAVAPGVDDEADARRDHVAEAEVQLAVGSLGAERSRRPRSVEAKAEVQDHVLADPHLVLDEQGPLVRLALRVLIGVHDAVVVRAELVALAGEAVLGHQRPRLVAQRSENGRREVATSRCRTRR